MSTQWPVLAARVQAAVAVSCLPVTGQAFQRLLSGSLDDGVELIALLWDE